MSEETIRPILLNPGPVTLTDRVRQSLASIDLCHREPEFAALVLDIKARLLRVYPEAESGYEAIVLSGSGTLAVEAMMQSLVPADGKVLTLANGVYGERIDDMLATSKKRSLIVKAAWPDPMDLAAAERLLRDDPEITHANDAYLLRLSCYIHRNPLKAGIVQKLSDYPWSSYPFYAYKKKPPIWLNIKTILNQVPGQDCRRAYRIKVQKYSDEQGNLMDDIKHGLIYGSERFVESIKKRFLKDTKEPELPQHNRLYNAIDPESLLKRASGLLDFDLEAASSGKKIRPQDKESRDILVYWIWKTGRLSNQQIGTHFGLTYSAVSKIVSQLGDSQLVKRDIKAVLNKLYSHFKV